MGDTGIANWEEISAEAYARSNNEQVSFRIQCRQVPVEVGYEQEQLVHVHNADRVHWRPVA